MSMREIEPPMDALPPGFTPAGPGGAGAGGMSAEQAEARKAQQEEMEARRQFMLDQILTPEAKDRLSRIGQWSVSRSHVLRGRSERGWVVGSVGAPHPPNDLNHDTTTTNYTRQRSCARRRRGPWRTCC